MTARRGPPYPDTPVQQSRSAQAHSRSWPCELAFGESMQLRVESTEEGVRSVNVSLFGGAINPEIVRSTPYPHCVSNRCARKRLVFRALSQDRRFMRSDLHPKTFRRLAGSSLAGFGAPRASRCSDQGSGVSAREIPRDPEDQTLASPPTSGSGIIGAP